MTWNPLKKLLGNNDRTDGSTDDSDWDIDHLEAEISTGFGSDTLLTEHTISLDVDTNDTDTAGSRTVSGGTVSTGTTTPRTEPTPDTDGHPKGTFAFPADQDFMQKLESRGLNGTQEPVETVYVLTGPSHARPTDLVRLDNPEYYVSATRRSVRVYSQQMAEKVAALYPEGESPNLVARFHTHPSGTTRPSSTDKDSAEDIRDAYATAFGTDEFTFFHGIHAYTEHGGNPGPDERHQPTARSNGISWKGERYRHELALFDPTFRNPQKVSLDHDI